MLSLSLSVLYLCLVKVDQILKSPVVILKVSKGVVLIWRLRVCYFYASRNKGFHVWFEMPALFILSVWLVRAVCPPHFLWDYTDVFLCCVWLFLFFLLVSVQCTELSFREGSNPRQEHGIPILSCPWLEKQFCFLKYCCLWYFGN